MTKLPTLYKSTKTGVVQVCDIQVDGPTFTVTFGQLDGKMQSKQTTCKPMNVGRSNATTAEEQAILEAQSKWNKKVKSGYSEDISAPITVQLPQKVKSYVGSESKIKFPAYSTFKLNGVNGTYWLLDDGSLKLTSRGGDEYPPIPHLEPLVLNAMRTLDTDCLNGELYIHGEHLQDITSAVKKPKELSKKLMFVVFELPHINKPYKDKIQLLKQLRNPFDPETKLSYTGCLEVNSQEDIEDHYDLAMENGYEGTVIYNADAEYKFNERSSSVYKYKKTLDAEFQVLSFELDKNNHPVYTCQSSGGPFKVKRKGTNSERLADASIADSNIGKWLTVELEAYSKDNKPLKPVGLNFRNCDEQGNPNE